MINSKSENGTWSAEVELSLHVEGRTIPVAKVGPRLITLVEPTELPATKARLSIVIDGEKTIREVQLSPGAAKSSRFVPITAK